MVNDNTIGESRGIDPERGAPMPGARPIMMDKVKVWIDLEVDYLEVAFSDAPGHMRPTKSGAMMKRVDEEGRVIGFSVFGVSRFQKKQPLDAELDGGT